jgi:hypothetical protein
VDIGRTFTDEYHYGGVEQPGDFMPIERALILGPSWKSSA